MMILRGVTLFPFYCFGGPVENFQKKLHRASGDQPFFPGKEKEMKMLLNALTSPVFYFKMLFIYFKMLILEYET